MALGCSSRRIQFTPDLLPADITGTYVLSPKDGTFTLRAGPIFANIVLADEINRAPAKTQSALLEAMQERQVTIEGDRFELPLPFLVLATQNPIDLEGTYPLPEAQIDRFLVRVAMATRPAREEVQMLKTHALDPPVPRAVLSARDVASLQGISARIYVEDDLSGLRRRHHHGHPRQPSRRARRFPARVARARASGESRGAPRRPPLRRARRHPRRRAVRARAPARAHGGCRGGRARARPGD